MRQAGRHGPAVRPSPRRGLGPVVSGKSSAGPWSRLSGRVSAGQPGALCCQVGGRGGGRARNRGGGEQNERRELSTRRRSRRAE